MNQINESIERKLKYLADCPGELEDYTKHWNLDLSAEYLKHGHYILLKDLLMCYIYEHEVGFVQ